MADFTALVRICLCLLSGMMVVLLAGCAHPERNQVPVSMTPGTVGNNPTPGNRKLIVTPETVLSGKVVRVNEDARFAVLNFPVGMMPRNEQRLNVYRRGLKVGEVKVTGPQQDDNTVADIMNGEVRVGDELREN